MKDFDYAIMALSARQLDSQDHDHARIHLARFEVMRLWPNQSGSDQSLSYEELLAAIGVV